MAFYGSTPAYRPVLERYSGQVDRFSVYASHPAALDHRDPPVAAFR